MFFFFWAVWLGFKLVEPSYCRFIAMGSDLYFMVEGKPIQLRVDGTQIVFRSRSLPSFEADVDTRRITSNLVFLLTLFLATPGMPFVVYKRNKNEIKEQFKEHWNSMSDEQKQQAVDAWEAVFCRMHEIRATETISCTGRRKLSRGC